MSRIAQIIERFDNAVDSAWVRENMKIPAFNVQGMMPRFLAHFTPPPFAFSLLHGLCTVWRYISLENTKQRESENGKASISLL